MKTKSILEIHNQKIEDMSFGVLVVINCQKCRIKTFFELLEKIQNKDSKFEETFGDRARREILEKCAEKLIDFNRMNFSPELKDKLGLHEAIQALPIIEN